jgi:hypothetical protein
MAKLREEAVSIAAPQVPADALVDGTDARKASGLGEDSTTGVSSFGPVEHRHPE